MDGIPQGASDVVHFVGSVCLPNQCEVTKRLFDTLHGRLRRISDGETGKRENFVIFQREIFNESPFLQLPLPLGSSSTAEEATPGSGAPQIKILPIQYDDFAISGYKIFCQLRQEGMIPRGVRFQVSLPTPVNVVGNLIKPSWRAEVEPIYEAALLAALRQIQEGIPAHDLAIQWDLASEFAYLENVAEPPWFTPIKEGLLNRVLKLAAAVDHDVTMGFHLCYGDLGHKHFLEPKDTRLLVDFGNALLQQATRRVDWLHMPVPISRVDAEYFVPLKELKLGKTELYLGLLHAEDEEGTRSRIQMASQFIRPFGIATECGLGRSSEAELGSILEIARRVKGPATW